MKYRIFILKAVEKVSITYFLEDGKKEIEYPFTLLPALTDDLFNSLEEAEAFLKSEEDRKTLGWYEYVVLPYYRAKG
jgi:hypothetical protein